MTELKSTESFESKSGSDGALLRKRGSTPLVDAALIDAAEAGELLWLGACLSACPPGKVGERAQIVGAAGAGSGRTNVMALARKWHPKLDLVPLYSCAAQGGHRSALELL